MCSKALFLYATESENSVEFLEFYYQHVYFSASTLPAHFLWALKTTRLCLKDLRTQNSVTVLLIISKLNLELILKLSFQFSEPTMDKLPSSLLTF